MVNHTSDFDPGIQVLPLLVAAWYSSFSQIVHCHLAQKRHVGQINILYCKYISQALCCKYVYILENVFKQKIYEYVRLHTSLKENFGQKGKNIINI